MKQANIFNPKFDSNPVLIDTLMSGQLILTKVRFNSKRFIFQPAWIIKAEVGETPSNHPKLTVRLIGGAEHTIFVRLLDDEMVIIDSIAEHTKVKQWVAKEVNKMSDERQAITDKINKYSNLI